LRPEVRVKLLEIAADFEEFLGLNDVSVQDITISGSNAAYSYTNHSDIDLHLVVAMPQGSSADVYRELFDAKKYQYNDLHNIRIGGADVELYVQDADQPHHSQGIYSVRNNQWISVPRRRSADVNDSAVQRKYQDLGSRIENILSSSDHEQLSRMMTKIKTMRAAGLEREGEFGVDNIVFKLLRNNGLIKRLVDARSVARDAELSLNERKRKKKSSRVRYGYGGYWTPGYNFGGTELGGDSGGGDGGGGESVREASTPDGVSASTKMFLEQDSVSTTDIVRDFVSFCVGELGIQQQPQLRLRRDPAWSQRNHSFGQFDPDSNELNVSMANRHVMDILRTVAHELVHYHQQEQQELPPNAGATGSKYENEANARAGQLMRNYGQQHPELFEPGAVAEGWRKQQQNESSGYIPTKKERNDPRFSMALSPDVQPGATGKNANKLALKTNAQGQPGLLMKTANLREDRMPSQYQDLEKSRGSESKPTMPAGTVRVDVSDVYDWYKLGQHISNMKGLGKHDFGKGPPAAIVSFGSEEQEHKYIQDLEKTGLTTTDLDPVDPNQPAGMPRQKTDPTYNVAEDDLSEIDRRGVLKAIGAGALAAAVPGVAKAGPFVDVAALGKSNPEQAQKVWTPRYQELTARCQVLLRQLIAAAGPKWAPLLKGTTIRVVSSENYAQASAISRLIAIDLSVFWDAPDAALAFTIAHELGHIALEHGVGTDDESADYKTQLRLAAQYRQGELDADEFAVRLCKTLGYNKAEVFKFIAQNEAELQMFDALTQSPTSSHPSQKTRIERARMNGFQLSKGGIEQMNVLKQHLAEHDTVHSDLVENLQQEFALFEEQDLFEINMSPSNLRAEAAKTGAIAGMEFEMIVPDVDGGDDGDMEPDYDQDERCRSIEDAAQFFADGDYNSRRQIQQLRERMENDFQEWMDNKLSQDWDSRGEEFLLEWVPNNIDESEWNPDGLEGKARQEALEEYIVNLHADPGSSDAFDEFREESDYDESDWLDAEDLDRMTGVENAYDITWPHYTSSGGESDIESVAQDFENSVGRDTQASGNYHSGSVKRPGPNALHYVVEPDGSLDGDNSGDTGLEFVSPPLPIDEILSDLNKVRDWAKQRGCYTNDSTGLHINISVPNYSRENLDFVKLALLMGDKYVLDSFGRAGNTYAKSALDMVRERVRNNPEDAAKLLDKMKGNMDSLASKAIHSGITQKYTSINTKEGHIEFRSPGGDWLDENFDQIENTLLRFTVAMSAALNPAAYREEYLKKLYALLKPKDQNDTLSYFAKFAAGELPKAALKSFIRQAQLERKGIKTPPVDSTYTAIPSSGNQKYEIQRISNDEIVGTFNAASDTDASAVARQWLADNGLHRVDFRFNRATGQERAEQRTGASNYKIYQISDGRTVGTFYAADQAQADSEFAEWLMSPEAAGEDFGDGFRYAPIDTPIQGPAASTPRPRPDIIDIEPDVEQNFVPGSTLDLQRQRQYASAVTGSNWDGQWKVIDSNTGEELYRFGGIGNSQADANRIAGQWVRSNNISVPTEVYPVMEP
jgi:hypothetical protein